jgi:hypothetical protein
MCYKLLGVFIHEGMYLLFSASTHWLTEYLAYTTFRMMITKSSQNLQFELLTAFQVGLSMLNLSIFLFPFVTQSVASFVQYFIHFPANQDFFLDDLPVKIKAVFLLQLLVFPVQQLSQYQVMIRYIKFIIIAPVTFFYSCIYWLKKHKQSCLLCSSTYSEGK